METPANLRRPNHGVDGVAPRVGWLQRGGTWGVSDCFFRMLRRAGRGAELILLGVPGSGGFLFTTIISRLGPGGLSVMNSEEGGFVFTTILSPIERRL